MIFAKHVLTSARCVVKIFHHNSDFIYSVDSISQLRHPQFKVCPVYNNGEPSQNFGCAKVGKVLISKDILPYGDDICVLELDQAIGWETGWVRFGFNAKPEQLISHVFHKFSYPKYEFYEQEDIYDGDTLFYSFGKLDFYDEHFIHDPKVWAAAGESGSSLLNKSKDGSYTAYSVLSTTPYRHDRIDRTEFYGFYQAIQSSLSSTNLSTREMELLIYPNPAKEIVNLKSEIIAGKIKINLYDTSGMLLRTSSMNLPESGTLQYSTSGLLPGFYYMNIETNDKSLTKPLIIQK